MEMIKPSMQELAKTIRDIYAQAPDRAEAAVEAYLDEVLKGMDTEERLEVLMRLEGLFTAAGRPMPAEIGTSLLDRLVPLLLGRDVHVEGLSASELVNRLKHSLDTIFTTINELTGLINSTLGGGPAGDETIRQIIGASLQGEGEVQSIEQYLGQIRKAFLTAQSSSKEAARTIVGYILTELDPAGMDQGSGGFRIGPMKKAESFEAFEEKYKRVKKWFDSERFLLDFLRQFEKNCRKSFT